MSNQYNDEITGKLADVLDNYSDELLALATNVYHNTDTDKNIEDIVIDLKKQYHEKVLSNDMSIQQVEIELYQERCNTIYDY
jgi:hypothetical protein|tara:strand:- start:664 stop:909 length:246 start_codon:yes stop_codon:yes gene_type:complete